MALDRAVLPVAGTGGGPAGTETPDTPASISGPSVHLEYGDTDWPYLACGKWARTPRIERTRDLCAVTCKGCRRTRLWRWKTGQLAELFPVVSR